MVIIALGAAALLYPAKRVFFSMTGLNDYLSAANHIVHLRPKKAAVSTVIGLTKLCFSVGVIYLACKPLISSAFSSNLRPSDISKFKGPGNSNYASRVLRYGAFVPDSEAEKISKFCQFYFKDYPVTHYDVAKDCVLKLSSRTDDAYKQWVLNDPLAAAFRTSYTVDELKFESLPALKNCTVDNVANEKIYDPKSKRCSASKNKTDCVKDRIKYLKHIIEVLSGDSAVAFSNRACIDAMKNDLCQMSINELKYP